MLRILLLCLIFTATSLSGKDAAPVVNLSGPDDRAEVERLIASARALPVQRRVEFISKYLLGRRYHPETKERIKKQSSKPAEKKEATNAEPIPVEFLRTSMSYLDCMTYVEHVLALAASDRPEYYGSFLCRLIDIMFNAAEQPLMNHHRNHFTSFWGDINESKGYLINLARNHPQAVRRDLILNQVGANRTFYVEDRFMIATSPQTMWYFPVETVLKTLVPLASGDVVAMVTDKEGLDVTHMGFLIEYGGRRWLRHASLKLNRIVDQDFDQYLRDGKHIKGVMAFRPVLKAAIPAKWRFETMMNSAR